MSNSYDWGNDKKIYEKFHYMIFWEKTLFFKSRKQGGCYFVLLKVQYRTFNIAISEFFEKLCHLIMDQKVKK